MKSNHRKKNGISCQHHDGLMQTIHDQMNYQELIDNTMGIPIKYLEHLPLNVQRLIVKTISANTPIALFVDTQAINLVNEAETTLTPITKKLLTLYKVTPKQFVSDYKSECFTGD